MLLVRCGEEVGIRRRPKTGLLAGLWELPSLEGKTGANELRARLSARGWQVEKLLSLRGAKHVFTHVEWHMSGFEVTLAEKPEGLTFVTPQAPSRELCAAERVPGVPVRSGGVTK